MASRIFLSVVALIVSASAVSAQDLMRWRQFPLGSTLASVAKLAGIPAAAAEPVHQRPVAMTRLEWRPRYSSTTALSQSDPVDAVVFDFYDDQLFNVTVDYAQRRIEGLSDADMIESISGVYGSPTKVLSKTSRSAPGYDATDKVLAMWGDPAYSVTLLRVVYPESFRMVIALTRLDALAKVAGAEARRLDTVEAPQRELERQKKAAEETSDALKKAAIANKAVFRP